MSSSSPTRRHLTSVPEDALAIELERRRSLRLSQRSANHSGQLLPAIHIGRKSSSSSIPASEKGDERDWARSLIADDRMLGPSSPTKKGKEKATMTPDDQGRQRERSVQTRKEADWVIDLDRVASGLEKWNEMDRVIVVLGDPSSSALQSILTNPSFTSTLLLIPSPSYSSLPIPGTTYPTVQYLNIPPEQGNHQILLAAADAARRWRTRKVVNPKSSMGSRRGSAVSMSLAPPATMSRPSSVNSFKVLVSRSTSSTSVDRPIPDRKGHSSPSFIPFNEHSSPFDVVLHYLPSPEKTSFQAMLQGTVMLTTAVLPVMDRKGMRDNRLDERKELLEVDFSKLSLNDFVPTLIHVLPRGTPEPLPLVLDSFMSSLLPSSQRGMKGYILPATLLMEPLKIGREETRLIGLEVILGGGLNVPSHSIGNTINSRSYLPTFANCRFLGFSLARPPVISSSSADSLPSLNAGYTDSNISPPSFASRSSDEMDLPPRGRPFDSGTRGSDSSANSLPVTPLNRSRRGSFAPGVVGADGDVEKVIVEKKKGWFGRVFTAQKIKA